MHPEYAHARYVQQHIGPLTAIRLRAWSQQGLVRSAKLGPSKQAARLYHLGDIQAVLRSFAGGRAPKRVC